MIDGIPEVSDFDVTDDTPRCPKCAGPMDRGRIGLAATAPLAYEASVSPRGDRALVREALTCIACGYTELYANPIEVRCALAGIRPPKLT